MIRQITYKDIPEMIEIARGVHYEFPHYRYLDFNEERVRESMLLYVGNEDLLGLVGRDYNGVIVGYLAAHVERYMFGDSILAFEDMVAIRPEYRREGYAGKFVALFLEWAKRKGARKIQVGTSTGFQSDLVKRFYENFGFEQTGYFLAMEVSNG